MKKKSLPQANISFVLNPLLQEEGRDCQWRQQPRSKAPGPPHGSFSAQGEECGGWLGNLWNSRAREEEG